MNQRPVGWQGAHRSPALSQIGAQAACQSSLRGSPRLAAPGLHRGAEVATASSRQHPATAQEPGLCPRRAWRQSSDQELSSGLFTVEHSRGESQHGDFPRKNPPRPLVKEHSHQETGKVSSYYFNLYITFLFVILQTITLLLKLTFSYKIFISVFKQHPIKTKIKFYFGKCHEVDTGSIWS